MRGKYPRPSLESRLSRYSKLMPSGCIEWTGGSRRHGYGHIKIDGKHHAAHRVVWQLSKGEIPEGMCILHKCDNPKCVNIEHLFLGTFSDNMRDMVKKGRNNGGWELYHKRRRGDIT